MNDLTRYSCQVALPGFDEEAQQKLSESTVLIVGMGGLGCPAAQYLVGAGVGKLTFADHDVVSVKNLHRQILYTPADEGKKKAEVAKERLQAQNPDVTITALDIVVNSDNVLELVKEHDIVVDCSDNFETRYLLNDACVLSGKPLVYGAIYQYEGQAAVWNVIREDGTASPNYRDLYPDVNAAAVPNCADGGVIPTIAGIIGCVQANEVIKYITGVGDLLDGKLLVFDAQTMQSRVLKLGNSSRTNITSLPAIITIEEITAEKLQTALNDHYLVDVRTLEEHEMFNIGGQHIPLQEIHATDIETEQMIVCYCASGKRSAEAVKILAVKYPGKKIVSLKGGLNNWPVHQG